MSAFAERVRVRPRDTGQRTATWSHRHRRRSRTCWATSFAILRDRSLTFRSYPKRRHDLAEAARPRAGETLFIISSNLHHPGADDQRKQRRATGCCTRGSDRRHRAFGRCPPMPKGNRLGIEPPHVRLLEGGRRIRWIRRSVFRTCSPRSAHFPTSAGLHEMTRTAAPRIRATPVLLGILAVGNNDFSARRRSRFALRAVHERFQAYRSSHDGEKRQALTLDGTAWTRHRADLLGEPGTNGALVLQRSTRARPIPCDSVPLPESCPPPSYECRCHVSRRPSAAFGSSRGVACRGNPVRSCRIAYSKETDVHA